MIPNPTSGWPNFALSEAIDISKCDFLVLSGDKWREKKFLLSDKSA